VIKQVRSMMTERDPELGPLYSTPGCQNATTSPIVSNDRMQACASDRAPTLESDHQTETRLFAKGDQTHCLRVWLLRDQSPVTEK
jgi:hypothetical protein